MRVTDRRGEKLRAARLEDIRRRILPAIVFIAVGVFLLGVQGCALIEVSAGRARVTSAWFWIALSAFAALFLFTGLELVVIGSSRLFRGVARALFALAPGRTRGLPPVSSESPGERARWERFWRRRR